MLDKMAIDRLKAIPSEMQVVKMLFDRQCILSEAASDSAFREKFQKNHIDIVAYLPNYTPGFMRGFKLDVKSHDKKYNNIFLETQTRPDPDGKRHISWALYTLQNEQDIAMQNRYLADVLDESHGISFRQTIERNSLIDISEPEEKNAERIIDFFSDNNMELLDHEIIVYSYVDINKFLKKTGGIDLDMRKSDRLCKTTHVKYIVCPWVTLWDQEYGRAIYSYDKDTDMWTVSQRGKYSVPGIVKLPYWRSIGPDGCEVTERENEYGLESFISFWQEHQKNGLTSERMKAILGTSYYNN